VNGTRRGALPGALQVPLVALAATGLVLGTWAQLAPADFYDSFPFGRGWVAADGPYNEHLVRDFGGLNLALMALTVGALLTGDRRWSLGVGVGWLLFAVPHFVYHANHMDPFSSGDLVGNWVGTGSLVLLGAAVVVLSLRAGRSPRR
jgi:hypothetical protein